jgi:predicted  nucleic acid-binding Zn-ribbon protein
MSDDVASLTYELLKRVHADVADLKRDNASIRVRLSSIEQHYATMSGDLAQIRIELDDIRGDVSQIKRRLDMAEA